MREKNLKNTVFLTVITMVVAIVVLCAATFAWFTSNNTVGTDTVEGRSGTASLTLLIGGSEGDLQDTSESDGVEISQEGNCEKLMPVSTANLENFYTSAVFQGSTAVKFIEVTETDLDTNVFHGKIYLKMEGENQDEDATFNLYFDKNEDRGGVLGENGSNSYLLSASRLGLKIGDEDSKIFYFTEDNVSDKKNNTSVNGNVLENGNVLSSAMDYTSDPAVSIDDYTVDTSEGIDELPEEPIAVLTINETYEVDVYFYLEGCDEDCVDSIFENTASLHLAFYAVAN